MHWSGCSFVLAVFCVAAAVLGLSADPASAAVSFQSPLASQSSFHTGLKQEAEKKQKSLPLADKYVWTDNGANVNMYVLDTGVRKTHQEFLYDPSLNISGSRAIHGWSAIGVPSNSDDCMGHGTHVSGTIGGLTYGVAKNATIHAGARKQHRHERAVEAKHLRSFTLPAVVLSGLVAGLFAWRRRKRHRASRVPAVPRAGLLATAGAAAESRHRAFEERQNRRAPRHDIPHRPGAASASASGPSQAANTAQQRSFSHPHVGSGSSAPAQDAAVPRITRRRQGLQPETTEPGSTGSSSEDASSSRQGQSGGLSDSAVTSTLDKILLQAALNISDSSSRSEPPFSTACQTVQMPDEEEERTQNTDKVFVSEVDLALALALVQSMPWHAPSLDRPSASNSNEADTEASAPPMSSQQALGLQWAHLADESSARVAGKNPTNDDTPQDEYDIWNPPQYQPAEPSQADLQLSPWETANVFDSGLQPHPGRAHLDTGNSSCTLINSRFAKQLGLVNFDYIPTQAYSGTTRVTGVVHGVHIDVPIINIQYEIKGKKIHSRAGLSDQGSRSSWDLLISCNEISLFESDGFRFSATRH